VAFGQAQAEFGIFADFGKRVGQQFHRLARLLHGHILFTQRVGQGFRALYLLRFEEETDKGLGVFRVVRLDLKRLS
jgi:hypothetical protein